MGTLKPTVSTEIIPYIFYRDVPAALGWLARAFGFAETMRTATGSAFRPVHEVLARIVATVLPGAAGAATVVCRLLVGWRLARRLFIPTVTLPL